MKNFLFLSLSFNIISIYETFHFSDSTVFEVFSFPFIAGDPVTALRDPFSIVITEDMAQKYFGNEQPLGRTIFAKDTIKLKVTGVLKNIPRNSHFTFDFLAAYSTLPKIGRSITSWWSFGGFNYLLLTDGCDVEALGKKLHRVSANYIPEQETGSGYRQEYYLQPVKDIHLYSDLRNEWQANNKIEYIYIFSAIIGIFIACLGLFGLAAYTAEQRTKEIGIRKVLGATAANIVRL